MDLTRRGFLGVAGAAAAGMAAAGLEPVTAVAAPDDEGVASHQTQHACICPGCSAGCGVVCTVADGRIVAVEGDEGHPLNRGGLCALGAAQADGLWPETPGEGLPAAAARPATPLVRRPGADAWEPLEWDAALDEIADWVKRVRDDSFVEKEGKVAVNRCDGLASFGGGRLTTEEQYVLGKALRSWGVTRVDSEASLDRATGSWASTATIGAPSAAAPLSDCAHANVILSLGVDPVLNPAVLPWIEQAQAQGATWIVVDDHFTASAERADQFVALRPGTAIAFLNGLMNYLIQNDLWQHEYVLNFTNASYVLQEGFGFDVEKGRFSGWSKKRGAYDLSAWAYETPRSSGWSTLPGSPYGWVRSAGVPSWKLPEVPSVQRDVTLRNPLTAWQQLALHVSRYDIDTVATLCGTDAAVIEQAYASFGATGAPEQAGTIMYGAGLSATETGTQVCRAVLMVQLMLGNLGMAGGAVHDLTGEANSQGALDMGLVEYLLPGYQPAPAKDTATLKTWLEKHTAPEGQHTDRAKALVSLLKEWWGSAATVENDYGFDWLPKTSTASGQGLLGLERAIDDGTVQGLFLWEANPARLAGSAFTEALASLDFLVATDASETEATTFWRAPDFDAASSGTTVYLLPSAWAWEKDGTWVNGARWLQYSPQAVAPPEGARSAGEVIDGLWMRVAERYRADEGAFSAPILKAKWDYRANDTFCPRKVSWALNGYLVAGTTFDDDTVKLMRQPSEVAADGSTACGALIYSGSWNNVAGAGDYSQQPVGRREIDDPAELLIFDHWGFSWPRNVRIAGNRGSCGLAGRPWNAEKTVVEWDGVRWIQYDAADFPAGGTGETVMPDNHAFPQLWEQCGRLVAFDVPTGPLPEFYKVSGLVDSSTVNGAAECPVLVRGVVVDDEAAAPATVTACLRSGGWDGGGLGDERFSAAAASLAPTNYVEMPPELAASLGVVSGDAVRLSCAQGALTASAWVTGRLRPYIGGETEGYTVLVTAPYGWDHPKAPTSVVESLVPDTGDGCTGALARQAFAATIEKA